MCLAEVPDNFDAVAGTMASYLPFVVDVLFARQTNAFGGNRITPVVPLLGIPLLKLILRICSWCLVLPTYSAFEANEDVSISHVWNGECTYVRGRQAPPTGFRGAIFCIVSVVYENAGLFADARAGD